MGIVMVGLLALTSVTRVTSKATWEVKTPHAYNGRVDWVFRQLEYSANPLRPMWDSGSGGLLYNVVMIIPRLVMLPWHYANQLAGNHHWTKTSPTMMGLSNDGGKHRTSIGTLTERVRYSVTKDRTDEDFKDKYTAQGSDKLIFAGGILAQLAWLAIPAYFVYNSWYRVKTWPGKLYAKVTGKASGEAIAYTGDEDLANGEVDVATESESKWYTSWKFLVPVILLIIAVIGGVVWFFVFANGEVDESGEPDLEKGQDW